MRFRGHRYAGPILELAARYRNAGADELVFYDVAASPGCRTVDRKWVRRVADRLDIPFCVAGGIRSLEDAAAILESGAEKISINSPALDNPILIDALARRFGSQSIVVGIDSQRTSLKHEAWQFAGDPIKARSSGRAVTDWVLEVQNRGAGEVVLNCIGSDGLRNGYDIEHLSVVRSLCRIPLVASGGAGTPDHFRDVFKQADVDGALAAGVFHSREILIPELKTYLHGCGVPVRRPVLETERPAASPSGVLSTSSHSALSRAPQSSSSTPIRERS